MAYKLGIVIAIPRLVNLLCTFPFVLLFPTPGFDEVLQKDIELRFQFFRLSQYFVVVASWFASHVWRLEIRSAVQLAPLAFLSSTAGRLELTSWFLLLLISTPFLIQKRIQPCWYGLSWAIINHLCQLQAASLLKSICLVFVKKPFITCVNVFLWQSAKLLCIIYVVHGSGQFQLPSPTNKYYLWLCPTNECYLWLCPCSGFHYRNG